eukprot:TRINITY_DN41_c0_g1_i8.p1 TRINITY_DN41_c0_g1~~TRINITY_DN41_c0_g1_i8.p1  ORF type:complete len:398 (+),score=111.92 TRINITY_DN41_c0_g1_i8:40-1194(+)
MNRIAFLLLSFCVLFVVADKKMQVYFFDVGQGDSQLIVFPSGYSILVDLGEEAWNYHKNSDYVAKRIKEIIGELKVNTIVVSHTHLDHTGTPGYGGIWGIIEKSGLKFDHLYDRNTGVWKDSNKDGQCDDGEVEYKITGQTGPTTLKWACYVTNSSRSATMNGKREVAELCGSTQINPTDSGAKVTVVAIDGLGAKTKDGRPIAADWSKVKSAPSENSYSVGLLIQYNKFSYVTLGDLDGDYASGLQYNDIESTILSRVGASDLFHVNHHASAWSSCQPLLNILKPSASVISVGNDNDYDHPSQEALDRLGDIGSQIFLTERGYKRNLRGGIVANGDVIVETDGSSSMKVTAGSTSKTFKLKGTKHPACKDGDLQKKSIPTIKP